MHRLSLDIGQGEFVTIIGANGAGKSTLFNLIAGSFFPDEGSISLAGENITRTPAYVRARYIGRLFQDPMPGTASGMTIEENLALSAGRGGWLSGGQCQALTLMMATINPPKLQLDEHTAALDPATAEKVLALTRQIVEEQKLTCLMGTHSMHSTLELGGRTLMMDRGGIILDVAGTERARMTVPDLLRLFREAVGRDMDNDRILLG